MDLLKCQTCGLGFDSSVAHKEHYRMELHRYNLKRRTNDLGPVSETEYQRRKAAAQSLAGMSKSTTEAFHAKCHLCNRSFASKATLSQHLKSRKHLTMAEGDNGGTPTKVKATVAPSTPTTIKVPGSMDEAAMDEASNKAGEEEGGAAAPVDLSPEVCIFCNERCPSVESTVLHMWKQHGFHLPDGEYLVDVHGLLRYCAEKVKVGCLCLYCNGKGKGFLTARDVQRHMHSKSHCKLLYEEGEDLHEFRLFYDFSASHALPPCSKKMTRGKFKAQEDGMDDDEQSLETVDSDYEEVSGDGDEGMEADKGEDEDDEDEDVEQMLRQMALQVSELGELMLPDGRCLGRREYQRYYKQRYRPEDVRSSLVASKHESAGRLWPGMESNAVVKAGGTGSLMVRGGAGGEGLWGPDKAARKAVMKVTAAARRVHDKYRLRKEISTNKFHKRPQIDG
ncbi:c2h2-type zinc finger-containing protein [Nannochloropsis oceanica]